MGHDIMAKSSNTAAFVGNATRWKIIRTCLLAAMLTVSALGGIPAQSAQPAPANAQLRTQYRRLHGYWWFWQPDDRQWLRWNGDRWVPSRFERYVSKTNEADGRL